MPRNPKVSILLNCYNGEKFLKSAIDSALEQTFGDWELIFFNNCSTDSSKKIFFSYKDNRFKYFERKSKTDLVHARNEAINHASSNWIAILDSDDFWKKEKLEKQISALEKMQALDAKVVFSNSTIISNEKTIYKKQNLVSGKAYEDLLSFNLQIPWSSVLFEKDTFYKLGSFDTKYPSAHDLDYLLRCSKEHNFIHVDENLVTIRYHQDSQTTFNINAKGKYFNEIIKILGSKDESKHAVTGITKMKLTYIYHLLKQQKIISFVRVLFSISLSEMMQTPKIVFKKIFT